MKGSSVQLSQGHRHRHLQSGGGGAELGAKEEPEEEEGLSSRMKITNGNYLSSSSSPQTVTTSIGGRRFEIPLPFGYHMDLDFLRYCSEELVNGENLERLKDLKRTRRRQRKTLEALMGIKQEQKDREKRLIRDLPNANRRMSSFSQSDKNLLDEELNFEEERRRQSYGDQFMKEALKDAVRDFERCVADTSVKLTDGRLYNNNTFPRSSRDPEDKLMVRQSSNSSISSVSTSSYPGGQSEMPHGTHNNNNSNHNLQDRMETDSIISISSEMSASTLRNIREQMARSLAKLKDYEKQVEAIPVMQVKLSVLKEEKRLLMLQLKQKELEMTRSLSRNRNNSMVDDVDMLYDTEDDDEEDYSLGGGSKQTNGNSKRRSSFYHFIEPSSRPRARSESPYGYGSASRLNPEEFISYQRHKRSNSCGYNSDDSLISPTDYKSLNRRVQGNYNLASTPLPGDQRTELNFCISEHKKPPETTDSSCNTESIRMRDHGVNTTEASTGTRGTNTLKPRTSTRATKTTLSMEEIITKEESERRVQEAVFKTEEELMECPLLQKAMARVEEEVIRGGPFEKVEKSCQVGDENIRPFVIDVGLQADLQEQRPACYDMSTQAQPSQRDSECQSIHHHHPSPIPEEPEGPETVSIGVGECKVIEEPVFPSKFRHIGICTEKWVEVIKASKQTDTDDFAYKDTESPRVADILAELPYTPPPASRKGSYNRIGSPSHSRRTSASSPSVSRKNSRTASTMTDDPPKKKMSTSSTSAEMPSMRSVGTSTMMLPLKTTEELSLPAPGSPLTTPDQETLKFNLCDKCNSDIQAAAKGIVIGSSSIESKKTLQVQPPSPDTPWISKIPRPIPENPDVSKLKSASSTSNLTSSLIEQSRPKSPLLQRSKSSLTPSMGRKSLSPSLSSNPLSPSSSRRSNIGTPPPHPQTPPINSSSGSRRVPSPLARSYSPSEKRSLIPKLSPISQRKASGGEESKKLEDRKPSLIPRVVTPPALRKMYPKESDKLAAPDRNVIRKITYTKEATGVSELDYIKQTAEESKESTTTSLAEKLRRKMGKEEAAKEGEVERSKKKTSYPIPGSALFAPIDENRVKVEPSQEMKSALKILKDSIHTSTSRSNAQVTNAINIVQQEWFKTSSTKASNPLDVEDYLDFVEDMSKDLLDRVVNLTDVNGNTALHYSVSHGNFDVVSILLDSKVANPNILNKAGYTCIMLISLAQINNSTHKAVVERLFTTGDVNIRASQHGQTAIMLAVSHGRLDMVRLLVEAGGDINVRDEDGSTALMCAAEHGHMEIVKYLLLQPDTNVNAKDNDGLTALAVAMEAGHRDIGVVLYASMSFSRGASPYSSMRLKRPGSVTPGGGKTPPSTRSPVPPTPPHRSRRNSSNQ